MSYPTEDDLNDLQWIEMTQSTPWNPNVFDGECPTVVCKGGPNFVLRKLNKTVLLEVRKRREIVFTDTLYGDGNSWGPSRNSVEDWGDID